VGGSVHPVPALQGTVLLRGLSDGGTKALPRRAGAHAHGLQLPEQVLALLRRPRAAVKALDHAANKLPLAIGLVARFICHFSQAGIRLIRGPNKSYFFSSQDLFIDSTCDD